MKNKNIIFRYKNFVNKAVTFTIDDGNVKYDKMFIDIVKPYGITGTFNLCAHNISSFTPEGYREFYKGFDIANHCKYHPYAFADGKEYKISDAPFDPQKSDIDFLYKDERESELYHYSQPRGWREIATGDAYCRFIDSGKKELEEIFGENSVRGYVWPYSKQNNKQVVDYLSSGIYQSVRTTGCTEDKTNFEIPQDRCNWTYNANNKNLLEIMKKYENFSDDGELKFFAFGVHSVDFERDENWCDLEEFAKTYGNRPETYFYTTIADVMDYEDAVKKAEITDNYVKNNSDLTLYAEICGKKTVIAPNEKVMF